MAAKRTSRQAQSLLQRGIDSASEAAEVVAHKLSAAADPRARQLRKRKWALRLGLFFGFSSVFWVLVTGLLATWSLPVWALLITGLVAAGAAFPATLFLMRYRWLRATPLPPQRPASTRRLPPPSSAARAAMSALAASERGFFSLLGVMERGEMLPPEEIRELTLAANRSSATMAATAAEVVSIERAVGATPHSQAYLVPSINAFTAQLGNGVRQYNEMVTAAAHLVSAATGGSMPAAPMSQQRYRDELTNATDRLLGWAQAFDELGELRRA
ncbi:membrane protein [soil metagenome]